MKSINVAAEQIEPSKIVCVGRNYSAHITELQNEVPEQMVLFNKPNSAIAEQLLAQHKNDALHYETELCFVVKNNRLAAVGLGLDLTKREIQTKLKNKGLPWERAKAFDGSVLFTPFVALCDEWQHFNFELKIDGQLTQQGNSDYMLHNPSAILAEITDFMHLHDGDVIMTGTPAGVGEVTVGSLFSVALYANEQCLLEHQWRAQ